MCYGSWDAIFAKRWSRRILYEVQCSTRVDITGHRLLATCCDLSCPVEDDESI